MVLQILNRILISHECIYFQTSDASLFNCVSWSLGDSVWLLGACGIEFREVLVAIYSIDENRQTCLILGKPYCFKLTNVK